MEEIFVDIKNYEKRYQISNLGNVKSIIFKKHRLLKPNIKNGYYYIILYDKNSKPKHHYIHKLVSNIFINIDTNLEDKVVDHIDGNKLNNNFKNLRIVSRSENGLNSYNTNNNMKLRLKKVYKYNKLNEIVKIYDSISKCCKEHNISTFILKRISKNKLLFEEYYFKIEEKKDYVISPKTEFYPDEIFIPVENYFNYYIENYKISNYGRVFSIKNNIIIKPSISPDGYCILSNIRPKNYEKNIYIKIHRLVAYKFISKFDKDLVINHKDEDKSNNYYKNLEIVSRKENTRYSTAKELSQFDLNMNYIQSYECSTEALKIINKTSNGSISNCCLGKTKTAYGFIWKYK